MYQIRPYTADFVVQPAHIMYHMPNYHRVINLVNDDENENDPERQINFEKLCTEKISLLENGGIEIKGGNTSDKVTTSTFDEQTSTPQLSKENENDNKEVIKHLLSLSKRLDKFIASNKAPHPQHQATKQLQPDKSDDTKSAQEQEPKEKASKAGKKVERKEKRGAAIAATKSNDETIHIEAVTVATRSPNPQFTVKNFSTNSPDLLYANVEPTIPFFHIHDYKAKELHEFDADQQILLKLNDTDKPWVNLLNRIGQKRELQMVTSRIPSTNKNVQIVVEYGHSDIQLTIGNGEKLLTNLAIWKFIGSLLGLYSPEDSVVSAKTDKWLLMASITADRDALSRQLNSFLGAQDFLSSKHAICLADLILRSYFADRLGELIPWQQVNHANNVQLWIRRIDDSLNALF